MVNKRVYNIEPNKRKKKVTAKKFEKTNKVVEVEDLTEATIEFIEE